jgi:hypothetical protein
MTFPEALAAVFHDNDRIIRVAWHNRNIFIALDETKLCIKGVDADGLFHPWVMTESDYFADDWEVLADA